MEEAAWTLADELNKEYSVLKSSFGESIKAPPITGSCAAMKERSMLLLLPLELLPELPELLRPNGCRDKEDGSEARPVLGNAGETQ